MLQMLALSLMFAAAVDAALPRRRFHAAISSRLRFRHAAAIFFAIISRLRRFSLRASYKDMRDTRCGVLHVTRHSKPARWSRPRLPLSLPRDAWLLFAFV